MYTKSYFASEAKLIATAKAKTIFYKNFFPPNKRYF